MAGVAREGGRGDVAVAQEVSLADMSLSSLGVSSEPDNAVAPFADSTPLAQHGGDGGEADAEAEPIPRRCRSAFVPLLYQITVMPLALSEITITPSSMLL